MTSQSTNLGLKYYDAGDTSETFIDFRTDIASSSGSNMSKIDAFAGAISDGSFIIIDTGGISSAYTATGVTLLDGSTTFPSSVPLGTKILLKPNVANSGACTLQINGGDVNSLQKVYAKTDGISSLQSGDLQTAKYYIFFFNGSAWILLSPVTLNQIVVDDATNGDLVFSTTTNTYDIKTGAVTLPKMSDISSGRILGRKSSGAGVVEELTPADVISVLDLANALIYLGSIDCSTNPNYPTGNAGDLYVVSSAGKIGGASGVNVDTGDFVICNTDSTPSGDEATVGQYWDIIQANIDGAVTGTGSSVDGNFPSISGTGMAVIEDSGYAPSDFVAKTLYDANTIIKADADDTPLALTIPEQTIVGRITSGSVTALTATQIRSLINVEDGAEVNPELIPQAEAEAGTATTERLISAERMKQAIDALAIGGRTYNAVTVTTANVTAVEGNHYDLTIAGLTAERKFVLPTPSAAGVTISMRIIDGDDTYSIMPQANSVDLDGYNLFIAGESLVWRSTGTGAGDWEIAEGGNGKIKTIASQRASVAQTGLATATNYKAVLGTPTLDDGNLNDTANNRIVVRRAGKYRVTPKIVWQANANASQSSYAKTYVNGVYDSGFLTPNSANELITIIHPKEFEASAGDYFECYTIQNSGINRDLYYSLANGLWAQLTIEEM